MKYVQWVRRLAVEDSKSQIYAARYRGKATTRHLNHGWTTARCPVNANHSTKGLHAMRTLNISFSVDYMLK